MRCTKIQNYLQFDGGHVHSNYKGLAHMLNCSACRMAYDRVISSEEVAATSGTDQVMAVIRAIEDAPSIWRRTVNWLSGVLHR